MEKREAVCHQQLKMRGFDNIGTLSGGKDQWQTMVVEIQDGIVGCDQRSRENIGRDPTQMGSRTLRIC